MAAQLPGFQAEVAGLLPHLTGQYAALFGEEGPSAEGSTARARSHCRFALPLTNFIPDSLTYSVPLFLK